MKLKDVDIKEIAKLLDQHESKAKIPSMYHVNKHLLEQLERRYKMHGREAILHGQSKSYTINVKRKCLSPLEYRQQASSQL